LKAACAELSPRQDQKFEVGVFCGDYITPVKDDYFAHLDALRGSRKKDKEIELARQAVVQGVADGNDTKVVLAAAASTSTSKQARHEVQQLAEAMNGVTVNTNVSDVSNGTAKGEETPSPRRTQDISLHNLNDHDDGQA
jgi:amidophosphoribosyltransferase